MKRISLIVLAALGLLSAGALAQTIVIPYVTAIANADAIQVIKGGAPVSGNVYASMLQLQAWMFGGDASRTGATAPALTSCGTSPAISGNDFAGTVTLGTGTPTGCIITFNTAYAVAPSCVATSRTAPATTTPAYTVSASALTLTQAATSSNLWDYVCVAKKGT